MELAAGEGTASAADRGGVVLDGPAGVVLGDAPALAIANVVTVQIDVGADPVRRLSGMRLIGFSVGRRRA
jgi:hypothetical protein